MTETKLIAAQSHPETVQDYAYPPVLDQEILIAIAYPDSTRVLVDSRTIKFISEYRAMVNDYLDDNDLLADDEFHEFVLLSMYTQKMIRIEQAQGGYVCRVVEHYAGQCSYMIFNLCRARILAVLAGRLRSIRFLEPLTGKAR
jgi:hypothetical protein